MGGRPAQDADSKKISSDRKRGLSKLVYPHIVIDVCNRVFDALEPLKLCVPYLAGHIFDRQILDFHAFDWAFIPLIRNRFGRCAANSNAQFYLS